MNPALKKQLSTIHHFIVAIILILKGIAKIEHHHSVTGWTILILGFIILAYFIFLKFSKGSHKVLEIIIHLFESIALFLTSYSYFQDGKALLPYVTLAAAIGFLVAMFIHIKRHKDHSS